MIPARNLAAPKEKALSNLGILSALRVASVTFHSDSFRSGGLPALLVMLQYPLSASARPRLSQLSQQLWVAHQQPALAQQHSAIHQRRRNEGRKGARKAKVSAPLRKSSALQHINKPPLPARRLCATFAGRNRGICLFWSLLVEVGDCGRFR